MRIRPIFANNLYSFHYETEEFDEFERLFDLWQDPLYLHDFFMQNRSDLQGGFYGTIKVKQAVLDTKAEAKRLERRILELSYNNQVTLESLFRPLDDLQIGNGEFLKSKAYGDRPKSWLRIYALKIPGESAYVVTGGAIKLTATMKERSHTKNELTKLQRCKDFLREQGYSDIEGFKELDL